MDVSIILSYLCDSGALESLPAVQPPVATWDALSPVSQNTGRGTGLQEAEVEAEWTGDERPIPGHWARSVSAEMRRRGSGKDAHHHVKGEQNLG